MFNTIIHDMQLMSIPQLENFIINNDMKQYFEKLKNQAYDNVVNLMAEQLNELFQKNSPDLNITENQIRELLNDNTMRFHVQHEKEIELYNLFLQSCVGDKIPLIHPHPFFVLSNQSTILQKAGVLELSVYNASFIVPVLLAARAYTRSFTQVKKSVQSNGANILMYGAAGAGKTIISQMMSKYFKGYKWNEGQFQDDNILQAGCIILEEVNLQVLKQPQLKQVTDFTQSAKIDIKFKNPIDVTKYCPCVMTTNDKVFEFLNSSKNKKTSTLKEHVKAIRRRVSIVPFLFSFNELHKPQQYPSKWSLLYREFVDLERVIPQMANFFNAFSVFQVNINPQLQDNLKNYMRTVVRQFRLTVFGLCYAKYQQQIDQEMCALEFYLSTTLDSDQQVQFQMNKTAKVIDEFIDYTYDSLDSSQCPIELQSQSMKYLRKIQVTQNVETQQNVKLLNLKPVINCRWEEYIGLQNDEDTVPVDDFESQHDITGKLIDNQV